MQFLQFNKAVKALREVFEALSVIKDQYQVSPTTETVFFIFHFLKSKIKKTTFWL
jgi:hypothetical protein